MTSALSVLSYARHFPFFAFAAIFTWLFLSLSDLPVQSQIVALQDEAQSSVNLSTSVSSQEKARVPESKPTVVVASTSKDNTTWLTTFMPSWNHKIYRVDDPYSNLTVPINKGNEAMVYLTHIIDNYDNLPDITIFLHAKRYQWHNDDPDYDNLRLLRQLNLSYVKQQGYVNLRCAWLFGCSTSVLPYIAEKQWKEIAKEEGNTNFYPDFDMLYKREWKKFMPRDMPVPDLVQVPCCAQHAVSREAIHTRSKGDYQRMRRWLIETRWNNHLAGTIIEYTWHIIFGMKDQLCPDAATCYCNVYGLCDVQCASEGDCPDQYVIAPLGGGTVFHKGWPRIGWDGEPREPASGWIEDEPFPTNETERRILKAEALGIELWELDEREDANTGEAIEALKSEADAGEVKKIDEETSRPVDADAITADDPAAPRILDKGPDARR